MFGGAQRPLLILAFVVLRTGIHVVLAMAQHGIDEPGQLVGGGGDGLGRSQVGFLPPQEGAQGGRRLDGAAQNAGCSLVRSTSASSMQSPPASADATSTQSYEKWQLLIGKV